MSNRIYKIGQLVYGSCNGQQGVGNIVSIIDRNTNESYYEKEVVTGWGDKNTRVNITINIIGHIEELLDTTSPIIDVEKYQIVCDPHNVWPISLEDSKERYERALNNMNIKLEFIRKHSLTRDDKINIILND